MSGIVDLKCSPGVAGKWEGKTFIPNIGVLVSTEYLKDINSWVTRVVTATMTDGNVVEGDCQVCLNTCYSCDNVAAFFCHDIMVTEFGPAV